MQHQYLDFIARSLYMFRVLSVPIIRTITVVDSHCSTESPTRYTWMYMYSLFLYIFAVHVSGAICTHPQEHKLQSTALGVCNSCGMLVHWSRYWLRHPHTFSTVK
jgi:hypothetical protein